MEVRQITWNVFTQVSKALLEKTIASTLLFLGMG